MLKSMNDENHKNQNKCYVMDNDKKYFKDILEFKFYDENGDEYLLSTLLSEVIKLKKNNIELKKSLKAYVESEKKMDALIVDSVDTLSNKVVRDELIIKKLKEEL